MALSRALALTALVLVQFAYWLELSVWQIEWFRCLTRLALRSVFLEKKKLHCDGWSLVPRVASFAAVVALGAGDLFAAVTVFSTSAGFSLLFHSERLDARNACCAFTNVAALPSMAFLLYEPRGVTFFYEPRGVTFLVAAAIAAVATAATTPRRSRDHHDLDDPLLGTIILPLGFLVARRPLQKFAGYPHLSLASCLAPMGAGLCDLVAVHLLSPRPQLDDDGGSDDRWSSSHHHNDGSSSSFERRRRRRREGSHHHSGLAAASLDVALALGLRSLFPRETTRPWPPLLVSSVPAFFIVAAGLANAVVWRGRRL